MTQRVLEGANSFLVRAVTESVAPLLSQTGKLEEFNQNLLRFMMASAEYQRNPKCLRHAAEIMESMRKAIGPTQPASPTAELTDILDGLNVMDDVTVDPVDAYLHGSAGQRTPDPYTADGGPMQTFIQQYVKAWQEGKPDRHPFVRVFHPMLDDKRVNYDKKFVCVGTCRVKSRKTPNAEVNVNCTTGNFRKIKDAGDDILVYRDGRPVSVSFDTPEGDRYFLWLLHHRAGLEVRFWLNASLPNQPRHDVPEGNFRIRLTDDEAGYKRI